MLNNKNVSKIRTILDKAMLDIEKILEESCPNLHFYLSGSDGTVYCWVRTPNGYGREGIEFKKELKLEHILYQDRDYLDWLNELVEPASKEPEKYFYCTECGKVKPIEEFEESVFAGYYCKECAKKPAIAKLIEESHKKGFYD